LQATAFNRFFTFDIQFLFFSASGEAVRPFLPREAEAFASFSVFVLRTKAFAPSPRHFDQARSFPAGLVEMTDNFLQK
jgi:hypothetical protein